MMATITGMRKCHVNCDLEILSERRIQKQDPKNNIHYSSQIVCRVRDSSVKWQKGSSRLCSKCGSFLMIGVTYVRSNIPNGTSWTIDHTRGLCWHASWADRYFIVESGFASRIKQCAGENAFQPENTASFTIGHEHGDKTPLCTEGK